MRILILGARAPVCLEWARAFSTAGWEVSVADSLHWPVSSASHASTEYYELPEPRNNPDLWIDTLSFIIQSKSIDVLLPTCEEVFYLAYGLERLPCRVITMALTTLHELHHKYRFSEMIKNWSCSTPETHLIESTEDLAPFLNESSEWVFKPVYSRFANRSLIQPARQQLIDIQDSMENPWVAQRFVSGKEYCSFSLIVNGRVSAHACYHPRYRVGKGSGIWFEPQNPPAILAFIQQFAQETAYNGQVAFDFIESEDGIFHVLECNPRATSGVHLFDDQAIELVKALLGDVPEDSILIPSTTPRMISLAMILFAMPRYFWKKSFWKDFSTAHDVIVRPGDWKPLYAQIPGLLEIIGRALSRRTGLLAAATADIEWDGQAMNRKDSCD